MSFIAGVLLLNMDAPEAFVCLANLLNRSSYLVFFRMEHAEVKLTTQVVVCEAGLGSPLAVRGRPRLAPG